MSTHPAGRLARLETAYRSQRCETCYGAPVRDLYADGESMPETGCPTCGRPILRTHDRRWMTTAEAARLFRPAEEPAS